MKHCSFYKSTGLDELHTACLESSHRKQRPYQALWAQVDLDWPLNSKQGGLSWLKKTLATNALFSLLSERKQWRKAESHSHHITVCGLMLKRPWPEEKAKMRWGHCVREIFLRRNWWLLGYSPGREGGSSDRFPDRFPTESRLEPRSRDRTRECPGKGPSCRYKNRTRRFDPRAKNTAFLSSPFWESINIRLFFGWMPTDITKLPSFF